jgi:hypothetical protein
MQCVHFLLYFVTPICVLIIPDSTTRALAVTSSNTLQQSRKTWGEMAVNFAYKYLFSNL